MRLENSSEKPFNSVFKALWFLVFFFFTQYIFSQPVTNYSAAAIKMALKKLNTVGTVLYIAAHPDDENTRLLAYLAKEKNLRTCYLSITRGDGGQNLIGKEQGDLLGLIRTNELLQARKIDGAEQFFTRAYDFGYSKSPEETFRIWGHDSVLSDIVWLIRKLKPDVIITRFPITGEGGHGHHTASAVLAGEAYRAAFDSTKFPWQLKGDVSIWKTKSIWWNTFNFNSNNTQRDDQFKLDVGIYNSWLGMNYGELAAMSRSQHKSQGFGVPASRGKLLEYFKPIDGDTACGSPFCNLDFSWKRIKYSEKIASLCEKALNNFNPDEPSAIIETLIAAYNETERIENTVWRDIKLKEIARLILSCSKTWIEAVSPNYFSASGDSVKYKISVINYGNTNVTLYSVRLPAKLDSVINKSLEQNNLVSIEGSFISDNKMPFTNPFWLNEKHHDNGFVLRSQTDIDKTISDATYIFKLGLKIKNHNFLFDVPLEHKWTDPVEGEKYRAFSILPPATANFTEKVCMMLNDESKKIEVHVKSFTDSLSAILKLAAPSGYAVAPVEIPVLITQKGYEKTYEFSITPKNPGTGIYTPGFLVASFKSDKGVFFEPAKSIVEIKYNHIPYQTYLKDAEVKLAPLQIEKRGKKIGYIEGAGDEIAQCISQLGYEVAALTDKMLADDDLSQYDAIIAGVRAYNTNENMQNYFSKLMDYISKGGTYIVQYNTNSNLAKFNGQIGPYPFTISRDRVTDEYAPVSFNDNQSLLNFPNKITADDFNGWIQERGIYFAKDFDSRYETPFSMNDTGEKPHNGSTLVAHYGKGYFIYTGLAFFRQLPAGVNGAWRLFANMISIGKK